MSMRNPTNERYTADTTKHAGSTKRSAGSAKPASTAAASVRVKSGKTAKTSRGKAVLQQTMTKEERKAQKAEQREKENLVYTATSILTDKDERYRNLRRIWWVLLILAVVATILSWVLLANGDGSQALSVIVLVIAYAAIIGALVMDLTVIRKQRNVSRDKVASMTEKQLSRMVEENYTKRLADDAAKKAQKAAKKAGKSATEAEAAAEAARAEVMGTKGKGGATAEEVVEHAVADAEAAVEGGSAEVADEVAEAEAAEAARIEAGRKAAREFAASKRKGA